MGKEIIHLAHSPDSDDAFMFYALAREKIDTGDFRFVHELADIETLNRAALEGKYEVSAVSIHAFAYLHERYALLDTGASMGEGYGPLLVASGAIPLAELPRYTVAVPGQRTSAFLTLKLFEPNFQYRILAFDQIIPALQRGEVDAGLIIHEGQLTYGEHGLRSLLDLGVWWKEATDLPLPLGGNAVRRDLGEEKIRRISQILKEGIRYSLEHREEALQYALEFGRGLDHQKVDRFVQMYVNQRTLGYGEDGRRAVRLLLDRGHQAGIIPHQVRVDFV